MFPVQGCEARLVNRRGPRRAEEIRCRRSQTGTTLGSTREEAMMTASRAAATISFWVLPFRRSPGGLKNGVSFRWRILTDPSLPSPLACRVDDSQSKCAERKRPVSSRRSRNLRVHRRAFLDRCRHRQVVPPLDPNLSRSRRRNRPRFFLMASTNIPFASFSRSAHSEPAGRKVSYQWQKWW